MRMLVAALLFLCPANAFATTFTDLDDTRACVPTKNGFAVATGGGLVLLERGGKRRVLTALDGLPETRVHAVAGDEHGVWVGTEAGAAHVSLDGAVERTVGTRPVHAILTSPEGTWLGAWGTGLVRVDGEVVTWTHRITAIARHDGAIVVANADAEPARLEGHVLVPLVGLPTHGQALASTGRGLVVGDLEGLFRGATLVSPVDARALATSGDQLLVATFGNGLLRGGQGVANVPKFVRDVRVAGALRCAATTEGLFVDRGDGTFSKVGLGEGPPSNDVTALAEAGGRVAIGTFDGGAALFEGGSFHRVPAVPPTESVLAVAWQGPRLWVGTVHGIFRIDEHGARRFTKDDGLPASTTRALLVDGDRVIAGTDEGPAIIEGERVRPLLAMTKGKGRPLASPMHATWALAKDERGTLYVGTMGGLYYGRGDRFTRASLATGAIDDDWVTALAVDHDHVFVGTYAKGVSRIAIADGRVTSVSLGGGYVNPGGLRVIDGTLYASTMDGLLRLGDAEKAWVQDGRSIGRDTTGAAFASGDLWIATRRGIEVRPLPSTMRGGAAARSALHAVF